MKRHNSFLYQGLLGAVVVALAIPCQGQDKRAQKESPHQLHAKWLNDTRAACAKNANLKALAAKYPLVVITSRHLVGDYHLASYSFTYETQEYDKHRDDIQLLFMNGGEPHRLVIYGQVGQQNLLVDLGKWDFEKNPDIKSFSLDDRKLYADGAPMKKGHVYLERVRHENGTDFFVLFKVVALDPQSRYMGFVWRKLPGGKITKKRLPKH